MLPPRPSKSCTTAPARACPGPSNWPLTPAIIGGLGYLLDRWLGLTPVLTIIFFLVAMAGVTARMYYAYDAQMKDHEAAGPWAKPDRPA